MTKSALVVSIACVVALSCILVIAVRGARLSSLAATNAAQLKLHYDAVTIHAESFDGRYPIPGLAWRLPDPLLGAVPGRGPEDVSRNTTAGLYSLVVGQAMLPVESLLSPFERSPVIPVPYAHDTRGEPWDTAFPADLVTGSIVSYGHMPLAGQAKKVHWRSTGEPNVLLFGNRGPLTGTASAHSFSCRASGAWHGAFLFADGTVETLSVSAGNDIRSPRLAPSDNPFVPAEGAVAFTSAVTADGPVLQHD